MVFAGVSKQGNKGLASATFSRGEKRGTFIPNKSADFGVSLREPKGGSFILMMCAEGYL